MQYWFYLEPYTFLFRTKDEAVVYNTLNGAYLPCPPAPEIEKIVDAWDDAANGYGIALDEDDWENGTVQAFVQAVRESFSGDYIPYTPEKAKPYLFKPTLFLNTEIQAKNEGDNRAFGEHVLQNLNEVSLYLAADCPKRCENCAAYARQLNHCALWREESLSLDDYTQLLRQLQLVGVRRLNLSAGGDPLRNETFRTLLTRFADSTFRKHVWVENEFLNDNYLKLAEETNSLLEVTVSLSRQDHTWTDRFSRYNCPYVHWKLIVTSEEELAYLEQLDLPEEASLQLLPFYTGRNLQFFYDHVFNRREDILAEPIDRKTIFRRRTLNENFFGKLVITPSGNILPHTGAAPLGNIKEMSLKKAVYKEFTEGHYWLKTRRTVHPCRSCINRDLCPSLSGYELAIGKMDLCRLTE